MQSSQVLFYVVSGLIIGIPLFINGFVSLRRKRLIELTPTSKIRSIAMGPVEVYGTVVPAEKEMLISPLSEKRCVYYKYIVERYETSKNGGSWRVINKDERMQNFYIKDETGQVLVDPKGAVIEVPHNEIYNYDNLSNINNLPSYVNKLLGAGGMLKRLFIMGRYRFTEYLITSNMMLYVFGKAGDNPYKTEATSVNNSEDIMIQKGGPLFYISDKPEKSLLKSLKIRSIIGIFGGFVLIVGSLILIVM